ncbi:23S rRNA m(1)G-748 methyltransferase [Microterricola gilva]|uniref:23S rRNA m(1)G-748 methyltransferase n=1 Tax=Microterricola gilva TaxID=393267 RepID=A0A4Q8AMD8_9MICO|nr:methyltransferase domain-containing protein [Microterricola gilva]RZU65261.1 23S rRNA m(1)G-748 methyltransferase [Microterricola gilva]
MTLESLAEWLRCPHCGEPLLPQPPLAVRCEHGHSFDVNKRGYVNMLASGNRMIGDSPAMLDARQAFLDSGHYAAVREAVATFASLGLASGPQSVFDAGCGTGYYLGGVLAAQGHEASALAMDISPHAVARTVRGIGARCDGLVADTWQPLPVRDDAAGLIMTVFAPRNLPEFHRVLAPSGALLVVVPTAAHIGELRADGRALDIPAEKAERLVDDAAALFSLERRERVEYRAELNCAEAEQLVSMGPSAHHAADSPGTSSHELIATTVSVDVLLFRPVAH